MWTGFKFNFFDSLLKLASGIIFYLLNLSANLLFHTYKQLNVALNLRNLSTLGKNFSRHLKIFFLFFPENRFWHYMQTVSYGDNLHVMSKPVFWEKLYRHCFWKRNCKTSATMPQVLPIKENLSNLLELASDGNCSLLFEGINQHLAS